MSSKQLALNVQKASIIRYVLNLFFVKYVVKFDLQLINNDNLFILGTAIFDHNAPFSCGRMKC